jgi:hypothetical protein
MESWWLAFRPTRFYHLPAVPVLMALIFTGSSVRSRPISERAAVVPLPDPDGLLQRSISLAASAAFGVSDENGGSQLTRALLVWDYRQENFLDKMRHGPLLREEQHRVHASSAPG